MDGSQEPLELSHGEEGAVVPVLGYLTLLWFLIPSPLRIHLLGFQLTFG